jgi:ubiquinone/menaquinone biosynthesis C-methylase UbiE
LAQSGGFKAYGIDFAISGVRQGQNDSPQSGWIVGDGEALPLADNSIDYITHIGSLEHYLNPLAGAKEIHRTLKQDGRACILLPNAYGLLGNILHVWRFGEIFDDGQPLQRYATRQTWETLLNKAGLKIIKIIGYGEIEPPRDLQNLGWYLSHPRKILRFLFTRFIPLNLSNHFVFICTRDTTTEAKPNH